MLLAWTAAVAHGAALSDATPAAADHISAAAVHTTSLAVLSRQARAVCSGNSCLWDNAVVPYWYDSGSLGGRLSTTRTRFAQAIAYIEAKTVLTFRPKRSTGSPSSTAAALRVRRAARTSGSMNGSTDGPTAPSTTARSSNSWIITTTTLTSICTSSPIASG